MRTILIKLNSQARGNSKLRPRVPVKRTCQRTGGFKTKNHFAHQKFKSLKVTPIALKKSGKMLVGDNVFELDNYWADEADGIAESTFCPSEFNPTPLVRSRQKTRSNAFLSKLRTRKRGINDV